jgi:hypothetical protein
LSYSIGQRFFLNLRANMSAELGSLFRAYDFHLLMSRFGSWQLRELELAAHTYVVWRQDPLAAKGLPYFDLIDQQLFSDSTPTVARCYQSPFVNVVRQVEQATEDDNNNENRRKRSEELIDPITGGSIDDDSALAAHRVNQVLSTPDGAEVLEIINAYLTSAFGSFIPTD